VLGGSTTFTMLSTTAAFRDRSPGAYRAVHAALEEAVQMIRDDHRHAADVLIAADASAGFSHAEIVEVLGDPAIAFTTTPENIMRYAEFMHALGSIRNAPESWRDLFFPEIHAAPGG
jgi:NitT/TauT family transport system substrate-binding protein